MNLFFINFWYLFLESKEHCTEVMLLTIPTSGHHQVQRTPMFIQKIPKSNKTDIDGFSFCFWIRPDRYLKTTDIIQFNIESDDKKQTFLRFSCE